jgi:hypothetical protein
MIGQMGIEEIQLVNLRWMRCAAPIYANRSAFSEIASGSYTLWDKWQGPFLRCWMRIIIVAMSLPKVRWRLRGEKLQVR